MSTTKTLQARHVRAREITCLRALSKKIGVHLKQTEVMSRPERKAHNSHVSRGKQATEEVNTGNKELKQTVEDEEDPFDTRIKKSGCADLHYALLVSKALRTERVSFHRVISVSVSGHFVSNIINFAFLLKR